VPSAASANTASPAASIGSIMAVKSTSNAATMLIVPSISLLMMFLNSLAVLYLLLLFVFSLAER